MSGMDFHEELSRRHPEVASRVFFLTGGAFTTKTRAFLDTVPGRYLEKPFQSADLLRFVADRICLALQRIPEGLPWYPSKTENTPPNSPLRIPEMKQQPGALNEPPHLLAVVGRGGNRERLKRLAHLASAEVREVASADELLRLALSPAAVLLPLETPAEEWAALRASPDHGTTPLLGLTDEATELAFAETFARGGEDLLLLQDPDDALARLRAIPAAMAAPRTRARCALIVSERAGWRGEMARRLRVAGVEVRFAGADQEALDFAAQPSVSVVVLDATARLEGAVALVETLRRQGIQVPVLLAVQPGDLGRGSAALQGQTAVAVHDALGLAEALLFVVNEMTAGAVRERRQSPRVLFGTCVWVRPAGGERDRIGYSYTVSEGGLFVRTVDPSPVGARLWVETNPPRVGRRVRLVATVAWARGVGPLGEAISPPGMGLRIDGGLPGDWEVYREGCQALFALHRPPGQQG
jgi:DNA-binding response OmpR family regulator